MITESVKKDAVDRSWFIIDAKDKILGRLASDIAQILRGKNKEYYTPHMDISDYIIVINADKVALSSEKANKKEYWRHTGYPGGQKVVSFKKMRETFPEKIIYNAVKGMLPHNRLGRKLIGHLKVYCGENHPHAAQKPEILNFN